jgi:hypothetical protein
MAQPSDELLKAWALWHQYLLINVLLDVWNYGLVLADTNFFNILGTYGDKVLNINTWTPMITNTM